ncbi:MAG: cellulase family glycosylhydrolase, partial [Demequina sp.]|uniref:cellulase family glycosylhydrolase n=1 Tax=Demequina sp. TaxID=2050685 RepID=UPI003A83A726
MSTAIVGTLVAASLGVSAAATAATGGFSIDDGRLVDANGVDFVPQGVNHAHAWYPDGLDSLADIRAAGANSVRVVLSGGRWGQTSASEVQTIIDECKANELVCILEDHDTTGYGEDGAATSLATAAQYWASLAGVLEGEEEYVLINIGNEPYGNSGYQSWGQDTIAAIATMRAAGIDHTLIADAPNWGQDWSGTMQSQAATVAAADGNTMFSIHMYG